MRTSTEIQAEITKAKAMNSCGLNYADWAKSDYMTSLQSELRAALEAEATLEDQGSFTEEELENISANIIDLSDRLITGVKADKIIFDDIFDEDDYECATLDDIKYDINFDME